MFRAFFLLFNLLIHGCWATSKPPSNRILAIKALCTRDLITVQLEMGGSFRGIVFAKDFQDECRAKGNRTIHVGLVMPTAACGIRMEHSNGTYDLAVRLIVQMDEKLRQSSDIERMVRCSLPDDMMAMHIIKRNKNRTSRMKLKSSLPEAQQQLPPAAETPSVRVWLEVGGTDGTGAVEVGQMTTVAVRAVLPNNIGVRVVNCAALDGIGEASQTLLDERGCTVDEQVMPSLYSRTRSTEEGWSKPHDDEMVEKIFTATFSAFKFPDRERLHVSCGVQLCKGKCPPVDCRDNRTFALSRDQHLAFLEVFNSLTVTAPRIDLDRMRINHHEVVGEDGVSVDEYATAGHRPARADVLCVSTSKLAMAFCVLGLIFIVAVITSISCMFRAKSHNSKMRLHNGLGTSIFSLSSGSQSRFGSKLILAGGSLPYGRVY